MVFKLNLSFTQSIQNVYTIDNFKYENSYLHNSCSFIIFEKIIPNYEKGEGVRTAIKSEESQLLKQRNEY